MNKDYEDIINLPHHVSKKHPRMSMLDRAAQFAPFAALTGHRSIIADTAGAHEEKYSNLYTQDMNKQQNL